MSTRFPPLKSAILIVALLMVLTVLSYPLKDLLYRGIAGTAAASKNLGGMATLITEPGLIALVVLTSAIALWTWLRGRAALWRLTSGGVGVILAYILSEGIKLLVMEERPCRVLNVPTVLACPSAGDWSWPSNHSVIAAAFATACVLALPRFIWFTAPAAVLIGLSRVAVGAHYLHDVFAGLALGTITVLICVSALGPVIARLPTSLTTNANGRTPAKTPDPSKASEH